MVLVLSSMMMLRHDEGARTVVPFEYNVAMPHGINLLCSMENLSAVIHEPSDRHINPWLWQLRELAPVRNVRARLSFCATVVN